MDGTARVAAPWHEGEVALQKSAGVVEQMDDVGRRFVRSFLLDEHREFYAQLAFLIIGSVDPAGHAWASILHGREGFISTPDEKTIYVSVPENLDNNADAGIEEGAGIGALGIDLNTRRRNRVNGRISRTADDHFVISVEQSYGNCPQYIRQREADARDGSIVLNARLERFNTLTSEIIAIITKADTFFVATYNCTVSGEFDVDVSHRGGKPGFVRINDDGSLTIPDFAGNLFFNTLGNIALNGKAGLLFIDFQRGDVLQLSGMASVDLSSDEIRWFQGAERLWHFRPMKIIVRRDSLPIRWRLLEDSASPNSLITGDWDEAAARAEAARLARQWRPFRVERIVDHNDSVRSIYLVPADGGSLVPFEAGQFLPIRLEPVSGTRALIRTYSLSLPPSENSYRITVKANGVASRYLKSLTVGDSVEARAPEGMFQIDAKLKRPAVFLAAGVGVTPILSMIGHLVFEGLRTRQMRRAYAFYAAHSKAEQLFADELKALAEKSGGSLTVIRLLSDLTDAVAGADFDRSGRLTAAMLNEVLPASDDYDFFLCGPPAFMRDMYEGLRGRGVPDASIFYETFGAAAITRMSDLSDNAPAQIASGPVPVSFSRSGKATIWEPRSGSFLDLAEAIGLEPEFSCRHGTCGTCRTKLISGEVTYISRLTARLDPDEVLICCSVPAASAQLPGGTIRLEI